MFNPFLPAPEIHSMIFFFYDFNAHFLMVAVLKVKRLSSAYQQEPVERALICTRLILSYCKYWIVRACGGVHVQGMRRHDLCINLLNCMCSLSVWQEVLRCYHYHYHHHWITPPLPPNPLVPSLPPPTTYHNLIPYPSVTCLHVFSMSSGLTLTGTPRWTSRPWHVCTV